MGTTLKTIIITNDVTIATDAQQAGVSRIMVDLEWMGKKERQASRTTFLSTHQREDIQRIRDVLTTSELIVRINPWNPQSLAELEFVLACKPDMVMLPMITKMDDFAAFVAALKARAVPMPLVETAYSMTHIAEIASYAEVKELYLGLNDLHLSLGLDFLFEPLALGLVDWMAERIKAQHKPFGFGGIALMGSGELPAERILAEHVRLGSSCVILSSRFCKDVDIATPDGRVQRLQQALQQMAAEEARLLKRSAAEIQADAAATAAKIQELTRSIRKQRASA